MTILQGRHISACECVFRLFHLNLRHSSIKCIFLNTRIHHQRSKVLKFHESRRATAFCANIFELYDKRPTQHVEYFFETSSLLEFAMRFELHYNKKQDNYEEVVDIYETDNLQTKNLFIRRIDGSKMLLRNIPAVVRVLYFKTSDDTESF